MRLAHSQDCDALRRPSPEEPWRVLVSGCLTGLSCGADGTDYGLGGCLEQLLCHAAVRAFAFCPEDHAIGTPRGVPDIYGGDGRAVLRGDARILDQHGEDLTEAMIEGARAMLVFARANAVELAVLTDMSGACGSQVISLGSRFAKPRRFQQGLGVAAALLDEAGVAVVAQRDFQTLGRLQQILEPGFEVDPEARDHHEHPWTVSYFGEPKPGP